MGFRESYNHTVGALTDMMDRRGAALDKRDYGDAFANGGWEGVGKVAGERGDFTTATSAGNNAWTNEQRQTQRTTAERTETQRRQAVLANVLNHIKPLPYEQRRERIQQLRPRLLQEGFPEQMVDSYDPTDEKIDGDLAVAGQLSEYAKVEQDEAGRWVGVTRDGRVVPIEGAPSPVVQTRLTPEEAVAAGYRPGTVVQVAPDGTEHVRQAPREFSPNQMNGQRAPSGYEWTPDGELVAVRGGPADSTTRIASGDAIRASNALASVAQIDQSLQEFRRLLQAADRPALMGLGANGAALASAHRALALRMKGPAAFDLGALVGADFNILNDTIGEPGNVGQLLFQGGKEGMLARLEQVESFLKSSGAGLRQQYSAYANHPALQQYYPNQLGPPPTPDTSPGSGPARSFNTMPPAAQFQGRTVTDSSTGKRYRSDGRQWTEVR